MDKKVKHSVCPLGHIQKKRIRVSPGLGRTPVPAMFKNTPLDIGRLPVGISCCDTCGVLYDYRLADTKTVEK